MDLEKSFIQATTIRIADEVLRTKHKCLEDETFRNIYNEKRTPEEKLQLLKSSAVCISRGIKTFVLTVLDDILPKIIKKPFNNIWAETYMKNQYFITQETMKLAEVCANVIETLPQEQKTLFLTTLKDGFNQEGINQTDATNAYNLGLRDTGGLAAKAFRL